MNGHDQVEPSWPYGGRHHRDPQPVEPALCVEEVTLKYPGAESPAVFRASLRVNRGERLALVGPNGAGKSTLLKAIAGLLVPQGGEIRIFGNPVGACHHRTAYLPQRADLDWKFPVTAAELVMTGRYVHLGWLRRPGRSDRELVHATLERLGIARLADRQISRLSGGQQQRTLLARALVQQASLFLLDEPLNAVDDETRVIVDKVLADHARDGGSVVAATHDLGRLAESFDRAVVMREGRAEVASIAHAKAAPTSNSAEPIGLAPPEVDLKIGSHGWTCGGPNAGHIDSAHSTVAVLAAPTENPA